MAAACLIGGGYLNADVTVQNSDVIDSHYTYQLGFEELGSPDAFAKDRNYSRNVRVIQEIRNGKETGIRAIALWPNMENKTAEICFRFDFSQSDYRPTKMSVRDNFSLATNDSVDVDVEYSTDGRSWKPIRSTKTPSTYHLDLEENSVSLNEPSEVFYRITFTVSPDDTDGVVTHDDGNQWNRTKANWGDRDFKVDFELAPRK